MGKPNDPDYWRRWRAAHPGYRARERARGQGRDHHPDDRTKEYAQQQARRLAERIIHPEIVALFPDLVRGVSVSFWEEELAKDLRQEALLAELEGNDPAKAVDEYRRRERRWWNLARPWLFDE